MPETVQRLGWNKVTAAFWALWGTPAAFQVGVTPCERSDLSGSLENIF